MKISEVALVSLAWICLRGPQKIKNIHYRFPSSGGFPIGKTKNHLKQNRVRSSDPSLSELWCDHSSLLSMAWFTGKKSKRKAWFLPLRYRGFRWNMFPWSIIQLCDLKWLQSGAPVYDSVQLVQITPMSLWFMVPITIVFMGFINHQL